EDHATLRAGDRVRGLQADPARGPREQDALGPDRPAEPLARDLRAQQREPAADRRGERSARDPAHQVLEQTPRAPAGIVGNTLECARGGAEHRVACTRDHGSPPPAMSATIAPGVPRPCANRRAPVRSVSLARTSVSRATVVRVQLAPSRPNVELRVAASGEPVVVFAFPYDAALVDAMRAIPGRRFDWDAREWSVPRHDTTAAYVADVLARWPALTVDEEVH